MAQTILNSGKLPSLNFPLQKIQLRKEGNIVKIFDSLRKKYLVLTPEEFVRQQFVSWLRTDLKYPTSLIANEVGIKFNGLLRRCDTVIYDSYGKIFMIVEFKSPDIVISQITFDQIVRYNMILRAKYLVVTNGKDIYCCKLNYQTHSYSFLNSVPSYYEIMNIENLSR